MRQLKYIEDECFFKEIQALKEFRISHYCDIYEIAHFMEDDYTPMHITEIEAFLNSFELSETNTVVYTDDYIFVFNEHNNSNLFQLIISSIKKGIKMNDDNNLLKIESLHKLNAQLMEQLDKYKKYSQKNSPFKSLEEMHSESQIPNESSNISINSFNLFKW